MGGRRENEIPPSFYHGIGSSVTRKVRETAGARSLDGMQEGVVGRPTGLMRLVSTGSVGRSLGEQNRPHSALRARTVVSPESWPSSSSERRRTFTRLLVGFTRTRAFHAVVPTAGL